MTVIVIRALVSVWLLALTIVTGWPRFQVERLHDEQA
jgi:hypothetical protein